MIKKAIVVGLGSIALRHRKNLKSLFPSVCVIAVPASGKVKDQNIEFSDKVIERLEIAIQEDPDIAIVASPAPFHALHTVSLLHAGVPTLIEKPVTSNLQDLNELMSVYKETETHTAVGYCLRYMPSAVKMKEFLDQKIIGNVYNAFVDVGQYLPDWRPSKDYRQSVSARENLGGGVLLELSHEVDYLQWLLGPMQLHYAQLRCSSELDLEVEELADLVLVSEIGTVCNIHMDFLQKEAHRTCSFIGKKGRIEWNLLENSIILHTKNSKKVLYEDQDWNRNLMYTALLEDFVRLVKGDRNCCVDLIQAGKTVELIENIKKNSIQGVKQ